MAQAQPSPVGDFCFGLKGCGSDPAAVVEAFADLIGGPAFRSSFEGYSKVWVFLASGFTWTCLLVLLVD